MEADRSLNAIALNRMYGFDADTTIFLACPTHEQTIAINRKATKPMYEAFRQYRRIFMATTVQQTREFEAVIFYLLDTKQELTVSIFLNCLRKIDAKKPPAPI